MSIDILTAFLVLVLVGIFYYIYQKYSYWSSRGVPGPRAIFPFGYALHKALYKPHDIERKWMAQYGKVYGVYIGLAPTLTVIDAELIKQIMVRDFGSFMNRRNMNSHHELWNTNLFMASGDDWKRVRSITSPSFSVGRLKLMIPLMLNCVDKLTGYLDRVTDNQNGEGVIVAKDVFAGFTIDVIALAAFATETNANDGRIGKPNPLVENGKRFFNLNPFKIVSILILPRSVLNWLGITQPFKGETFDYFVSLAKQIVKQRKEELEKLPMNKRNDLIQLLIDSFVYENQLPDDYAKLTASMESESTDSNNAKDVRDNKKSLTENEIIAQCIVFLAAGFETTAATITHCIFELVNNLEIQQKLFVEIRDHLSDTPNEEAKIDTILNKMIYLDAVIKETLRKYPPVVRLERRVGVDGYKLGSITLDKDILIEIPSSAVHYCPENYPEPDRFNPERFIPENIHLIKPYTYLPFGVGPRNCVGMRFAVQEIKLCLTTIIQQYKFARTADTPEKLDFLTGIPMLNAKPFTVRVIQRSV